MKKLGKRKKSKGIGRKVLLPHPHTLISFHIFLISMFLVHLYFPFQGLNLLHYHFRHFPIRRFFFLRFPSIPTGLQLSSFKSYKHFAHWSSFKILIIVVNQNFLRQRLHRTQKVIWTFRNLIFEIGAMNCIHYVCFNKKAIHHLGDFPRELVDAASLKDNLSYPLLNTHLSN